MNRRVFLWTALLAGLGLASGFQTPGDPCAFHGMHLCIKPVTFIKDRI